MTSPDCSNSSGTRTGAGPGADSDRADHLADLVEAVRRYRNAERFMRGQSRDSMHLGRTDMAALRLMLRAGQAGRPLSAAALARGLGISSAATTVLIDRLEKSGHAERRRSTTDGRAIEIWPTAASDEEVRSTMGVMHERMMAVAAALPSEDCTTVNGFLGRLGQAMSALELPHVTPAPPGT
ncbi:MarR family transcriptional regulator [Arthrobacter cheniae]|uniref:MarR family transcriptional regulator n=1 Tax=Arthrobacter cheniae TaxID=1258888 RepID=A0A3A5M507_9MICC|nr:MarR family transcriptional regulator [Arthrobacter cheniae]RJT82169.1 MarR family transcriptional regulator [Arthrobacter cheniae]